MEPITLPELSPLVVYAIFDQAMVTHPYHPGCDNGARPRLVMLEAARLIRAEYEGLIAKRQLVGQEP